MDLKGWQDTKRRQNIEVSIDYLQNIQVSDFIVYTHTACVMDNISVYIYGIIYRHRHGNFSDHYLTYGLFYGINNG